MDAFDREQSDALRMLWGIIVGVLAFLLYVAY